jgi:hypothetical protein
MNNQDRLIWDGNRFYTELELNNKVKLKKNKVNKLKNWTVLLNKDNRARSQKGICK